MSNSNSNLSSNTTTNNDSGCGSGAVSSSDDFIPDLPDSAFSIKNINFDPNAPLNSNTHKEGELGDILQSLYQPDSHIAKLEKKIKAFQHTIAEYKNCEWVNRGRFNNLFSQFNLLTKLNKALEQQNKAQDVTIQSLEKNKSNVDQLQKRIDEQKATIQNLEKNISDVRRLQKRINDQNATIESLEGKYNELKFQFDAQIATIGSLDKSNNGLKNEINKRNNTIQSLKNKIDDFEVEIDARKATIQNFQEKHRLQNKNIYDLTKRIDECNGYIKQLEQKSKEIIANQAVKSEPAAEEQDEDQLTWPEITQESYRKYMDDMKKHFQEQNAMIENLKLQLTNVKRQLSNAQKKSFSNNFCNIIMEMWSSVKDDEDREQKFIYNAGNFVEGFQSIIYNILDEDLFTRKDIIEHCNEFYKKLQGSPKNSQRKRKRTTKNE